MLESELKTLIENVQKQKCESNYIELKSAKEGCPKLFDTFSSFSNQPGGGKILFGIDDNYEICGVYDAAELQKKIMEQSLQMSPEIRPLCTVTRIGDATVVCAEIQEIDNFDKPCFYKGVGRLKGSYIRVGDGDRRMTEYEVYSYEAFKKKIRDELRTDSDAEIEDIQTSHFDEYMIALKKNKPNLSGLPLKKILRLQGFVSDGKPTLTAIMLFGDYPQAFYPQLSITAVVIPGTHKSMTGSVGERFIDNTRVDGNIGQMLNETMNFVRRNMKMRTIIDPNTGKRTDRSEYPVIAIRELILNALIHRDYSIHTDSAPIVIEMYSDRFEIENPGGLYGRMTLDQLGKVSADTRNPFIANALELLGQTENRYSGIPTIINAMEEYNLPAPKFENDRGVFKVTLYNSITERENITEQDEILDFCREPRTRTEIEEYYKGRKTIAYVMATIIHPLIESGDLKMTVPEKPKSKYQKYYSAKIK
ncbi:MAG: putative DNA binding domain-containing protein [Oscillospiraceae bacterium]|nr:putative DNA binding domain-containing protein [Oscillospiraceae bacterium]